MNAAQLTIETVTLKEQIKNVRRDLDDAIVKLGTAVVTIQDLRTENAALREKLESHIKQTEKWDNRVWALIGLFVGATLSLAGSLLVNSIRK